MSSFRARLLLPSLLAAAGLALGPSVTQAQTVSEVSVKAGAPTEIRIDVRGKDLAGVRSQVRVAARYVCRNAVSNAELDFTDFDWCRGKTTAKALKHYAAARGDRHNTASSGSIVLSAR